MNSEVLFTRRYNELFEFRYSLDYYRILKSSAIIRQLLIDEKPLIHLVNKNLKHKIEFIIDNTFYQEIAPKINILCTSTEPENLAIINSKGLRKFSLDKFLNFGILDFNGSEFTVIEIIKFASNKQGGVHFDDSKTQSEIKLKTAFNTLDSEKILALEFTIKCIVEIVLIALRPIKGSLLILPDYKHVLAHYDLSKTGIGVIFEGKQWMHTDNMNSDIVDGFGFFGYVKLAIQRFEGKRYLYSICDTKNNRFKFNVFITKNIEIGCETQLKRNRRISILTESFRNNELFHTFFTLGCVLIIDKGNATLNLYLNNFLHASETITLSNFFNRYDRHVIGGDIKGRRSATFYLRELILLKSGLTNGIVETTIDYFEKKYKF